MENGTAVAVFALLLTLAPFIIAWILLAIVTSIAAHHRGRDAAAWGVLSLFIMGPFALICVLVMQVNQQELDERALQNGLAIRCSACEELIKPNAATCRYCGKVFFKR